MKPFLLPIAVALLLLSFAFPEWGQKEQIPLKKNEIEVYFSPNGGAQEAVIQEIDRAKKEVLVQAYGFSSASISQALANAKKRGLNLEVILDKCNETQKYSCAQFLANRGVLVMIDFKPAIASFNQIAPNKKFVRVLPPGRFSASSESYIHLNKSIIKKSQFNVSSAASPRHTLQ